MDILKEVEKIFNDFEERKATLVEELQPKFFSLFEGVFNKSDKIESFSWTQYTPYFNDGDPCTFSAYTTDIYINEVYTDELDWYDYRVNYPEYGDKVNWEIVDKKEMDNTKEIVSILASVRPELLESLFGDHCKVTVYKNGTVEVDNEYEHE